MKRVSTEYLRTGDQVGFSGSNVPASGVVIEDLGPDYVRVRWLDCGLATTHRRHGLERQLIPEIQLGFFVDGLLTVATDDNGSMTAREVRTSMRATEPRQ